MTSDPILAGMFSTPAARAEGWLQAMLDVEAGLARSQAGLGLIPGPAADAITTACDAGLYDALAIGRQAVASASPVVPLVAALRKAVGPEAAQHVHLGATSQDIVDTAMMLMAFRISGGITSDLDRAGRCLARLAREHRDTMMCGRTLLQPALPITFGLKCALWLDGLLDAGEGLRRARQHGLAVQLGGAAGTLASLGEHGPEVVQRLARELGLQAPDLPWHTNRSRVLELASVLAIAAGATGKVASDVLLMAQREVAEVSEGSAGSGRSSAMPHKRNPARAVLTVAAAKQAVGLAAMFPALMMQEHERAAGAWQAEWQPLTWLLHCTASAASHLAEMLDGLEVYPEAMRRNFDAQGGLPMAESLVAVLSRRMPADKARLAVDHACSRALAAGSTLAEAAAEEGEIARHLDAATLAKALDPANYLGSTNVFIDRALARVGSTA